MAPSLPRPADFEGAAALEEISDSDIHFSRLSGMSPADIEALRIFSVQEMLLIIIRCPKRPARYFHGKYPAKRLVTKNKSDPATGLAINQTGQLRGLRLRPDVGFSLCRQRLLREDLHLRQQPE